MIIVSRDLNVSSTSLRDAEILTDPLRVAYLELKEKAVTEEEAKRFDVTELVWYSLETRLKAREQINIQIRGDPTTGKSTLGSKFKFRINTMLSVAPAVLSASNKLIFSDQVEFLRWIGMKMNNICIQIDEFNRMIATGYNATTEMTLFDYYSDVFAQRFVHRVSCAPSQMIDRNCYLILDIEGRDLERKVTRVKVTYRDIITGDEMVVGHMDVYVGDIMIMPWYKKYREKKFKRMELLENNGIRDVRELEFAFISIKAFTQLSEMAKTKKVPISTVNKTVDIIRRSQGRIYSMLTMNEISSRCKGLLDLLTDKHNYMKLQNKAKEDWQVEGYQKSIDVISRVFGTGLTDETRLAHIYLSYINMGDEVIENAKS